MAGRRIDGSGQRVVLEWVPFPSPGDLPDPGIEPESPALQSDSLLSEPPEEPPKGLFSQGIGWGASYIHWWKKKRFLQGAHRIPRLPLCLDALCLHPYSSSRSTSRKGQAAGHIELPS